MMTFVLCCTDLRHKAGSTHIVLNYHFYPLNILNIDHNNSFASSIHPLDDAPMLAPPLPFMVLFSLVVIAGVVAMTRLIYVEVVTLIASTSGPHFHSACVY